MKEKVTVMRKYCSKQVDKKWKDMKLHCHEQFYDVIKVFIKYSLKSFSIVIYETFVLDEMLGCCFSD